MKVFIPSKNRASQLHLLIESIKENCPNLDTDIHVLYTATSKAFHDGYDKFIELNPSVTMEYEACFESDFNYYLKNAGSDLVMLLTDDCVFYRNYAGKDNDIRDLMKGNVWCFSYRLGLNTNTQYYVTREQQQSLDILGYDDLGDYIKWNWKIRPSFQNRGYFVSWDGHIYLASDLLQLAKQITFYNPRTFEDKLTKIPDFRNNISKKNMISPKLSNLFCNTINVTQEDGCPAGIKHHYSLQELNQRYLDGEIIDIESFQDIEMTASHEEVPIKFMGICKTIIDYNTGKFKEIYIQDIFGKV